MMVGGGSGWGASVVLLAATACIACDDVAVLALLPGTAGGAGAVPDGGPTDGLELVVVGAVNLSRDAAPRACADGGAAVSYVVDTLEARWAELGHPPATGCLAPGDEVLLANLQGPALDEVGQHELLRVAEVAGRRVTFTDQVLHPTDPTTQRLVLQRVPNYERLEVRQGGTLTVDAWDGTRGGVLVLRLTGEAVVDGRIDLDGKGFRGGLATLPVASPGQQGESIGGLGRYAFAPNVGGGGGGIADQLTLGCQQDGYPGGGGGHAAPGTTAITQDLCRGVGAGEGGAAYARLGRLHLGSGGGSAGTDNVRVDNPPGGAGGRGGGLFWLLAGSVLGTGTIGADGEAGVGDPQGVECLGGSTVDCYDHSGPGGGGSGGSVRISAATITLQHVSARGGRGGNGHDRIAGNGGDGGDGLVEGP